MLNWSESYNWTREEFDVTLRKAFVDEKKNVVSLDVEHSSASNIKALIRWARAAGYNAEETPGSEAVRVWKPDEKKDPAATTDRMAILEYAIVHGRQAAAAPPDFELICFCFSALTITFRAPQTTMT